KFRDDADQILENTDVQVGSYIRGQIIVASCIGVLLFIGYLIIGLDYAITLAVTAAITSVVPYLGPTIAISPAIIIAIVDCPFMHRLFGSWPRLCDNPGGACRHNRCTPLSCADDCDFSGSYYRHRRLCFHAFEISDRMGCCPVFRGTFYFTEHYGPDDANSPA